MQNVSKYAAAALLLAVGGVSASAFGQSAPPSGFFAWDVPDQQYPDYTPAPELNDQNAAQVAAQLQAAQAQGRPLAVRVINPLTSQAATNIFNQFPVRYVFADFEGPAAVGRTRAVADQVLASSRSRNAYVGNFNFYPNAGADNTRPANTNPTGEANSFSERPDSADYFDSRGRRGGSRGNQIAAPALYPGAPDYRNPAQGNSNAPNVRSALFTLPIARATFATNGLLGRSVPAGTSSTAYNTAAPNGGQGYGSGPGGSQAQHIPWVTRFNNWGNPALDSDGNNNASTTGLSTYEFVQNAANPANGQLLSRGDFQAQILHYRMRGANSVNLFNEGNGSVVGYSDAQEHQDVRTGFGGSPTANGIFGRRNFAFANLSNAVGIGGGTAGNTAANNGMPRPMEQAGAVFSGVYDRSGSTRRLVVLLSNLADSTRRIDLPNVIGGFRALNPNGGPNRQDDFDVAAGEHRELTFTLGRRNGQLRWVLNSNQPVFTDDNRNGIGIPEPTSAALLGIGALGLLARRRRQSA